MKKIVRCISLSLTIVLVLGLLPFRGNATETIETAGSGVITHANTGMSAKEVVHLREEKVKHFDLGDGVYQAVVYPKAIHELDSRGNWVDVDNELELKTKGNEKRFCTSDHRVSFSRFFSKNSPMLEIQESGRSITMTPLFEQSSLAARLGIVPAKVQSASLSADTNSLSLIDGALKDACASSVVYENVQKSISLEYTVDGKTVKENIVVAAPTEKYEFCFSIKLENMSAQIEPGGGIGIYDNFTNELAYVIPEPYMYDACFNMSNDVSYQLSGSLGNYVLTVSANEAWINDADRVFPVKIDPTITEASETVQDTYIDGDSPNEPRYLSSMLWVRTNRISYIKFPEFQLPEGTVLQWANLQTYYYYFDYVTSGSVTVGAYQVNDNWSAATQTWTNSNNYANHGVSTTCMSERTAYGNIGATVESPQRLFFDITDAARSWLATGVNYGVALKYISGPNLSVVFRSSESGTAYQPRMVYQYYAADYSYKHYYDSTMSTRAPMISTAATAAQNAFSHQFGIDISTTIPGYMDISSKSAFPQHYDLNSIRANVKANIEPQANEIIVLWTDYPKGTYCVHEEGGCTMLEHDLEEGVGIAQATLNQEVIFILNLLPDIPVGDSDLACMGINLIHETAHTMGLEDDYMNAEHAGDGYQCVMEYYHYGETEEEMEDTIQFFWDIYYRNRFAFCASCSGKLYELLNS